MASSANKLEFQILKPESWGGITQSRDLVFFLTDEANPEARVRALQGDQGVGKTSALTLLRFLLGGDEPDNAINSKDKKRAGELVIRDREEGVKYIVKCSTKGFGVVRVIGEEGNQITAPVPSPRDFLHKLVGPVGVSPMVLKEKKPAEQIKWLRDMYHFTEAQLKEEKELLRKRKETTAKRTSANNKVRDMRADLIRAGYFVWNKDKQVLRPNKTYTTDDATYSKDMKEQESELQQRFDEISQRHAEYKAHQEKMTGDDGYSARLSRNRDRIEDLRRQIAALEKENEGIQAAADESQAYINEHAGVVDELARVQNEMRSVGEFLVNKNNFEQVKAKHEDYKAALANAQQVDEELEDVNTQYKAFVAGYTPKVEGIEVCVPEEIDITAEREKFIEENPDAEKPEIDAFVDTLKLKLREGLFYKGHPTSELAESELWELSIELWRKMGVKVVLIENVNTLGSGAVTKINNFVLDGGHVFYSEMKRGLNDLKLSLYFKLT